MTSTYLPASIVGVNFSGYAVLGASLVCAILAGFMSPMFSAGIVVSLTACLIIGSNYQRDHVLKEVLDAMAIEFERVRKTDPLKYVQLLETIDVEQQTSTIFPPEELRNAKIPDHISSFQNYIGTCGCLLAAHGLSNLEIACALCLTSAALSRAY